MGAAPVVLLGDPRLRRKSEVVGDTRESDFAGERAQLIATLEDFRRRNESQEVFPVVNGAEHALLWALSCARQFEVPLRANIFVIRRHRLDAPTFSTE